MYFDPAREKDYNKWLEQNEQKSEVVSLTYRPLISVLIPVYNVEGEYLRECIESVLAQTYDNYEVCLVDDASTNKGTLAVLREYEKKEKIKIRHRKSNGHIAQASNDALEMAEGEFVALLDDDDLLACDALYEVVRVLNEDRKLDLVYSDEDKIGLDGIRRDPHFKPDFSPDTLMSLNYICHFVVARTKVVKEVGGFTLGTEGAQDYDLVLKITERTNKVFHISKVLYHWRMVSGSTAIDVRNKKYAEDNGEKVIESALERRGEVASVEKDTASTYYRVIYALKEEPMVSILVPVRDHAEVTEKCLKSIYEKTTYRNYEVILIDNGSTEDGMRELIGRYEKQHKNFRVLTEDIEFNYAKLNNLAEKEAKGECLVLLNNDTEVITPEWLGIMVGYAMRPLVGAVGAKLLYPDETVQHVGVVLGLGGVASHVYLNAGRHDLGAYGRMRVPYNYSAVTAACLCVAKRKFEEVGGLDENLKVAYNDVDFCLKLLSAGYYNVELPMVELYHFESKSRGSDLAKDKIERFNAEQKYMWKKWGDTLEHDRFYNANFSNRAWFLLDREEKKSVRKI